ncbi:MAG: hypothetical protein JOY80_00870 [Candidatus Dormibacteraeota bacterium]|nr:hypothetical protein [Candidatus Dormibacteraeota bacterium]
MSWGIAVPLLVTGDTYAAQWGAGHPPGAAAAIEGLLSTGVLILAAVLIAFDLMRMRLVATESAAQPVAMAGGVAA